MSSIEKKSKYAKKLARKNGHGRIDPRWQWWFERGGTAVKGRESDEDEPESKEERAAE